MAIQGLSNAGPVYQPPGVDGASSSGNLPVTGTSSVVSGSANTASGPTSAGLPAVVPATQGNTPGNPSSSAQSQQGSTAQVKSAVDALNQSMQSMNRDLTFSVDQSTKRMVVKVVEAQTGTVIAQIPSKQALAIAQSIDSGQQGLLLQEKA